MNNITKFLLSEIEKNPNINFTDKPNTTSYFLSITDLEGDATLECFIGTNSGNTQSALTMGYDSYLNNYSGLNLFSICSSTIAKIIKGSGTNDTLSYISIETEDPFVFERKIYV